ncbi:Soluble guanylate cyclase 89Db, partial [Operophtera brumata]
MYGWLLQSVQHFIVQECGEEMWETILREAGARNTVFSTTQQYPDALMLRLACALAKFITQDPNSPSTSQPGSPAPRKTSLKSKPSWRSASVHADNRIQGFKCPFTATNALSAATKKEIDAYTSSEKIRISSLSTDRINEGKEIEVCNGRDYNRRSLAIRLEDHRTKEIDEVIPETAKEVKKAPNVPVESQNDSEPTSPESENSKRSILKPAIRKTSCTVALDLYKRRGSIVPARTRQNSLNIIYGDKLSTMKEKFGTPEKAMHFFGRSTGRYFCTFLQSVDNIHQRMRFTFPHMRSPCMQLTRAHIHGAELVYSSSRTGYTHYLM